ncbi:DUF1573 domain-containing protein [Flexithrix dorotheae]|uniref:DUF1573 domain-containing protein n=1 Tax=Flexithrix dorotheae TaxID=70993 RepID=UPI00035E707C|nr:DUF1573 domain-containing protein [Flexithrix dorotheae]
MTKFFATILISFSFLTSSNGQSGIINFENLSQNLGQFELSKKEITHKFKFYVAGGQAIQIDKVDSDCACGEIKFPKESMKPGDFGFIEVSFEPYKPGPFEKTFTVYTRNAIPQKSELTISGFIANTFEEVEREFPVEKGQFRFKSKRLILGTITNASPVKTVVEFYNSSNEEITLKDTLSAPGYIEAVFDSSRVIKPNSRGYITIYYHPELKNDFGVVNDNVLFFREDQDFPLFDITVVASIKQHFPSDINYDNYLFPKLTVSDSVKNLGKTNVGEGRMVEFVLTNSGQKDLIIQKIVPGYGCEVQEISKKVIKPYDFVNLNILVKNIGKKGTQDRTIQLYCNDPERTTQKLKIKLYQLDQ